jgi:hypothetical protein
VSACYESRTVSEVALMRVTSTSPSRHRLCRRQASLDGTYGAPRPQMKYPQRHFASFHRIIQWRVTEVYGAQWRRRRRRCTEDCVLWADRTIGSSETANAPTPPSSAPGGLGRRLWGTASANHIPATSWREHSPPNTMARHRTLRRAMASTAAKTPRRLCSLSGGFLTEEVQSR